jgi:hypothetical protein
LIEQKRRRWVCEVVTRMSAMCGSKFSSAKDGESRRIRKAIESIGVNKNFIEVCRGSLGVEGLLNLNI